MSVPSVSPGNVADESKNQQGEIRRLQTEVAALHAQLDSARDQFQAILDAVPGGVSWLDRNLCYLGINSHLAQTFGLLPEDFRGRKIGFLSASPAFEEFARAFFDSDKPADTKELEMTIAGVNHVYSMMACKYRGGDSALFVGIDISERKEFERRLFRDAFFDKLTGLPNRALVNQRIENALAQAASRPEYQFAVLFLDFDGFKNVNDSLGHTTGDRLLQLVARRLEGIVRGSDTVSRLGGDEYVLLLEELVDLSGATQIAERIHRAMAMPFSIDGQEVFLSVSIGITINSTAYTRTDEVLRDADIAMYRAKAAGRNRYEVFDRAMHDAAIRRLQLETDLHHALENRDFLLHFQPIIRVADARIHSFEALVRWQRPRAGFTWPGEFIGLAEETGLIVHLDRWVVRRACEQMRTWLDDLGEEQCPVSVSVNLSSRHFAVPDLVEYVETTLRETQLPARFLCLEITESALMENIDGVAETLHRFEAMGVNVSLDDFGTGYSSLSYLHRLPLDTLKIDRSFVQEVSEHGNNYQVIRAIVMLAHSLDMQVVAEGIETPEQLAHLSSLGCDFVQGHLFQAALDVEGATCLLTEGYKEKFDALLLIDEKVGSEIDYSQD